MSVELSAPEFDAFNNIDLENGSRERDYRGSDLMQVGFDQIRPHRIIGKQAQADAGAMFDSSIINLKNSRLCNQAVWKFTVDCVGYEEVLRKSKV
jgi:hypothetical protein